MQQESGFRLRQKTHKKPSLFVSFSLISFEDTLNQSTPRQRATSLFGNHFDFKCTFDLINHKEWLDHWGQTSEYIVQWVDHSNPWKQPLLTAPFVSFFYYLHNTQKLLFPPEAPTGRGSVLAPSFTHSPDPPQATQFDRDGPCTLIYVIVSC